MSKLTVYLDIDGTILYDPGDETRREELDYQLVCEGLEMRLFPHLPACARRNHRLDSFVPMKASNPHNPARMLAEVERRMAQ